MSLLGGMRVEDEGDGGAEDKDVGKIVLNSNMENERRICKVIEVNDESVQKLRLR